MQEIILKLKNCSSRQESIDILSKLDKKTLVELSKQTHTFVMKIKKSELITRITENLVGRKLVSQAIREF